MALIFWITISQLTILSQGFLYIPKTLNSKRPLVDTCRYTSVDPGTPLFLTPYIEEGNLEEARKLARVPFTDNLNITSYSGLFTVDKRYDSNLFFWYFPPSAPKEQDAPVVVWLQGGPGVSSMYGLLEENGPVMVINDTWKVREFNWALHNHMIFIDSPVGTGYSFTNDTEGFCTNQTRVGENLYSAITQFFQLFPDLQKNRFYLTGESYAGKYVPAFAYTIHNKNPNAELKINLQGLMTVDGWTDPVNQMLYADHLYQIGLLDHKQAKHIRSIVKNVTDLILAEKWVEAAKSDVSISFYQNVSGLPYPLNYLTTSGNWEQSEGLDKIQTASIRKDLHVGSLKFGDNRVYSYLEEDIMKSITDWFIVLLDNYPSYVISGQLDALIPYTGVVNYLNKLKFNGSDEYAAASRDIWTVGDDVAGYMKSGGLLTEVLVRNAGHMVPKDQPEWALDLLSRLTTPRTLFY